MQEMVLCKIYRKATSMKVLEQRAAKEEETKNFQASSSSSSPALSMDAVPFISLLRETMLKEEAEELVPIPTAERMEESGDDQLKRSNTAPSLKLPSGSEGLMELQLPRCTVDWNEDSFWAQFNSPWFQNLTASANLSNF